MQLLTFRVTPRDPAQPHLSNWVTCPSLHWMLIVLHSTSLPLRSRLTTSACGVLLFCSLSHPSTTILLDTFLRFPLPRLNYLQREFASCLSIVIMQRKKPWGREMVVSVVQITRTREDVDWKVIPISTHSSGYVNRGGRKRTKASWGLWWWWLWRRYDTMT